MFLVGQNVQVTTCLTVPIHYSKCLKNCPARMTMLFSIAQAAKQLHASCHMPISAWVRPADLMCVRDYQSEQHWLQGVLIMPQCTMHCRHTVVHSCAGLSVRRFHVRQILHIFVSGECQVLKVGQYAKNDILVR